MLLRQVIVPGNQIDYTRAMERNSQMSTSGIECQYAPSGVCVNRTECNALSSISSYERSLARGANTQAPLAINGILRSIVRRCPRRVEIESHEIPLMP